MPEHSAKVPGPPANPREPLTDLLHGMPVRILLAGDHPGASGDLRSVLEKEAGLEILGEVGDGDEAVRVTREREPDLVIMNLSMPRMDGLEATRRIVAEGSGPKVLYLSTHAERRFVGSVLEAGASGYLLAECAADELLQAIRAVVGGETYLSLQLPRTGSDRRGRTGFHGIIGRDARMQQIFETVRQVARVDVPVLLEGERGTGKELVARALHAESDRADQLMLAVDCGGLPRDSMGSELFGHVRGASADAPRERKGRFDLANGSTIFLDEIGELDPSVQVQLLRVLQSGTFKRVGGERPIRVDVRLICATSRDLESEIAGGRFRADLYYRLCVVPITLPPLRERSGDISLIARSLLAEAAESLDLPTAKLSRSAVKVLTGYAWPGNVRELKNAMQHALIKADGGTIAPVHLPRAVLADATASLAPPRAARRKLTAEAVEQALEASQGTKTQAAQLLGVSRATLYRFLTEQQSD